jgi:hypothetical protein
MVVSQRIDCPSVHPATSPYCSHVGAIDASGLVSPRRLKSPKCISVDVSFDALNDDGRACGRLASLVSEQIERQLRALFDGGTTQRER